MLVAIIPAALPVLDLAPWSGRFYLDEFDLLILVSLSNRVRAGSVFDEQETAFRHALHSNKWPCRHQFFH